MQDAYEDVRYGEPEPKKRVSGWLIALIVVAVLLWWILKKLKQSEAKIHDKWTGQTPPGQGPPGPAPGAPPPPPPPPAA